MSAKNDGFGVVVDGKGFVGIIVDKTDAHLRAVLERAGGFAIAYSRRGKTEVKPGNGDIGARSELGDRDKSQRAIEERFIKLIGGGVLLGDSHY